MAVKLQLDSRVEEAKSHLEIRIRSYETRIHKLGLEEPRKFVDITHDGTGRICTLYYLPRTGLYEFEPIR